MNHHLNLFRFFNESAETVFIENNLSRAFALCLSNNSFLLNEYIQDIVTPEHYEYLFSTLNADTKYSVDVQIDTANIEVENYNHVYAVAMTSDRGLEMTDFFEQAVKPDKKNITDILISIKDIAIVIEVKRTGEDCKAQLYNQVLPFIKLQKENRIVPKCYAWQHVIKIMEKVNHVQRLATQPSVFVGDFLELSETRYPEWFEPKPFNVIPFSSQAGSPQHVQLMKRMRQSLSGVSAIAGKEYELLTYSDRTGVSVPFKWASEVIPEFESEGKNDVVAFYIWPGNTNQQGSHVYDKPMGWLNKTKLAVADREFPLRVLYNVKLTHFNKFVSGFNYTLDDVKEPLHTQEHFQQAGKWDLQYWDDFETWMDAHFKPTFDWRTKSEWEKKFKNTDRKYFTVSLGFEVATLIPYDLFQKMDKRGADSVNITSFIVDVVKGFEKLLVPVAKPEAMTA